MINEKKRYKLYKAGRVWMVAGIAAGTMMLFSGAVHADTDAANTTQTAAAATTPTAATNDDATTGNVSTTSSATQQAALAQVNAARTNPAPATQPEAQANGPVKELALNDDLNAWAQTRANQIAADPSHVYDTSQEYNGAPSWVSADGKTSDNLQQNPNYKDGDTITGNQVFFTQSMFWKDSDGNFISYFAVDPTQFTTSAVNSWISDANNASVVDYYLTMVSPYANVMGYAYSYNATTGATVAVLEVAYLPDKTETESKTVTRTINYLDKDTNAKVSDPQTQTVTYTRTKYTSQVDGEVTYSDWTSTDPQFAAISSPDLSAEGYATADPATVAAASTTADSANTSVNVYYDHADETTTESKSVTRTINYLDKQTNAVVSEPKTQTVTFTRTVTTDGVSGDTTYSNWTSTDPQFAAVSSPDLSTKGYAAADPATVVASSTTADGTNETVNVYYNHATTEASESKDVTRTINYLDKQTDAVVSNPQTQTVTFTRTATTDSVTGETTYSDWTSTDPEFSAVSSPDLSAKGYAAADQTTVADLAATADSQNSSVNVYYDHATTVKSESKTVKQTINYVDAATGEAISTPNVQTVTFTRNVTTDNVTGDTVTSDWTSTNPVFASVVSPTIAGYTTSQTTSASQDVTPDTEDSVITIDYTVAATKDNTDATTTTEPTTPVIVDTPQNVIASPVVESVTTPKTVVAPSKAAATKLPQTSESNNNEEVAVLGLTTLLTFFGLAGIMKRRQAK